MQFTNVTIKWSPRTLMFYLAIILGCYLITCVIPKKKIKWGKGKKEKYPVSLLIVAIVLLIVKCFNTTGRDLRLGYFFNFQSATSMSGYRDQTVEPGFRLLMVIIRDITDNYAVFLFVVGLITILPVIHFIHKYRDKIDVPAAVLLFTSIYFINSFSAYRQYMAVSISFFAFDAIMEKKPYRALAWIAISSTIHVACLALIIPYVLCLAKMLSKKMIAISAVAFFILLYLGRGSIASLLGGYERYSIYLLNQDVRFGFEQIVYYAPMFLLLYLCRKSKEDRDVAKIAYIYVITGFAFGMLSYILPIFGRMQTIFMPIIILLPYFIRVYKRRNSRNRRRAISAITVVYGIARFIIWITQYYNLEDLMPYTNAFGRII